MPRPTAEALLERVMGYFATRGVTGDPDGRAIALDIADHFEAVHRGEA